MDGQGVHPEEPTYARSYVTSVSATVADIAVRIDEPPRVAAGKQLQPQHAEHVGNPSLRTMDGMLEAAQLAAAGANDELPHPAVGSHPTGR